MTATTKVVSFDGVQVKIPAAWPVVGGNKTPLCTGSWPATPMAFVGIQPEAGISCPAPNLTVPQRQLDGIWLQPDSAAPSSGLSERTLPAGQQIEEILPATDGPGTQLLFHQVWIEIGPATSPSDATNLLGSLSYDPGNPDSPVEDACSTNSSYEVMPLPTRLDQPMVLDRGNTTLDPPLPTDESSVPATVAWNGGAHPALLPTSTYQLFLARFSSKFPAVQESDGSTVPEEQNVLAWVLYAHPVTTTGGCGFWALDAYDAHTGQSLGGAGWAPGP